jgi:hypothetical protein
MTAIETAGTTGTTPTVPTADPVRVAAAVAFAAEAHGNQLRKVPSVPVAVGYLGHLLCVAGTVIDFGGDTDLVIAAVLHDVVEDTKYTFDDIRERFGPTVAAYVDACTDTRPGDTPDAKSPWRDRKEHYIAHLEVAKEPTCLIAGADKLHNLISLTDAIRVHGTEVFESFNADSAATLWFYRAVDDAIRSRLPDALAFRFKQAIAQLNETLAAATASLITIEGTAEEVVITRNGDERFRGPLDRLEAATEPADWSQLSSLDRVTVAEDQPIIEALGALTPTEQDRARLYEWAENEEGFLDEEPFDRLPAGPEVFVNDKPWGWMFVDGPNEWALAPREFPGRADSLAHVVVGSSAGMVGRLVTAETRWLPPVAVTSRFDDSTGERTADVSYLTTAKWAALWCIEQVSDSWEQSSCPFDEDDEVDVAVETSPLVTENLADGLLDSVFEPCEDHAPDAANLILRLDDESAWQWTSEEGWLRASDDLAAHPTESISAYGERLIRPNSYPKADP